MSGPGEGLGLGLLFSKVYRDYSDMFRVTVWLQCEGEGGIEFQDYSEANAMSMVMVKGSAMDYG